MCERPPRSSPDPESLPPGSTGDFALQKTPCHIVSSFLPIVPFQRARLCVVEHESICFSSAHGLKESWDERGMKTGSTVREHLTGKVWETRLKITRLSPAVSVRC